jgi:hypothetical protein
VIEYERAGCANIESGAQAKKVRKSNTSAVQISRSKIEDYIIIGSAERNRLAFVL